METIRYENKWPWGVDIMHISNDGLCTVGVSKQDGFEFGFIHDLVVHETARNQGRGQYLLDLAELETIRTYKCLYVVLRVVPGTWIEEWYRRNGYEDYPDAMLTDGYIELRKKL